jgi:integrase/recombinase XerC
MSYVYLNRASGYYYYRDKNKEDSRSFSLKTKEKREALKLKKVWDVRIRTERAEGGVTLIRKSIPFDVAIGRYLEYKRSNPAFKVSTVNNDESRLEVIKKHIGSISVKAMSADTIDKYSKMRRGKVSDGTLNGDKKVWRAFMNWCVDRGYVKANPFKGHRIPKHVSKSKKALTDDEVKTLLEYDNPNVPWRKWAILMALVTGFRIRVELPTMCWDRITEDKILVETKVSKKYRDGLRSFPNSDETKRILVGIPRNGPWIFPSGADTTKHLSGWGIYHGLRKAMDVCGLEHKVPENLRDTFATLQVKAGTDPYTLMELMGHSDISTTMIYVDIPLPKPANIISNYLK